MVEWNGWSGTILAVDLTTGEIKKEPLDKELAVKYIGGRGIATRLLYDEVGSETEPLGPDNVIIVSPGVLCGTIAPSAGRYDLTSKSPYTGIYAASNGGGFFGPELRWAGYDLIIIRGRSEKPVYLWIDDDDVEIRDASHIWGQDTWVTQQMIRDELSDPEIKTLKIGPAGENLCFSSCVIGDLSRAAGKTAIGAVWGSKKLKAIAVRGSKGVNIAKPEQLEKLCSKLSDRVKEDPLYEKHAYHGTPAWVSDPDIKAGHTDASPLSGLLSTEFDEKLFDKNLACFGCELHCSHYYTVKEGAYKGTVGEGVEGNSVIYGGILLQVNNPAFVCKYTTLCNKLGLHVDLPGIALQWAMSMYRDGVITKDDTDGIEITPGNEEAILKLMNMMARKEGFGKILDGYPCRAVEMLGKGELYASDVKGMYCSKGAEFERSTTWGLALAVATRGRDHLTGARSVTSPGLNPEVTDDILEKLGQERYDNPRLFLDKYGVSPLHARVVFDTEHVYALCNMTGICTFRSEQCLYFGGLHMEDFAELLSAATGIDFTLQDVVGAAERQLCLQRAFNAREGIRRIDDYPHAFRWQLEHNGEQHPRYNYREYPIDLKAYDKLLNEYYKLRGCDLETGIPTRKKLEQVGLKDVANDLEKQGILSTIE